MSTTCAHCGAKLGEARMVVHDADILRVSGEFCRAKCYWDAVSGAKEAPGRPFEEVMLPRWATGKTGASEAPGRF